MKESRVLRCVVDYDALVGIDTGTDQALAHRNAQGGNPVGDHGPEFAGLAINEPDAAAIGANEVAGHVGIELQIGTGFPCIADFGGIVKNYF